VTADQRNQQIRLLDDNALNKMVAYLHTVGNVFCFIKDAGYASVEMVRRYVALSQLDMVEAQEYTSPADRREDCSRSPRIEIADVPRFEVHYTIP